MKFNKMVDKILNEGNNPFWTPLKKSAAQKYNKEQNLEVVETSKLVEVPGGFVVLFKMKNGKNPWGVKVKNTPMVAKSQGGDVHSFKTEQEALDAIAEEIPKNK